MKVLKTGGSLMQVKSIAECSKGRKLILWSSFELSLKTDFTVFTLCEQCLDNTAFSIKFYIIQDEEKQVSAT